MRRARERRDASVPPAARALLQDLSLRLDGEGLLADPAARAVYARDASHLSGGCPLAVALPRDEAEAAAIVGLCARHGVPWVARGAGTGLSGGAVPPDGALVVATARLDRLGPVDADALRVRAQVGVVNERVSRHAAPAGLHFAPDPSSQSAATIGGNVAENAGGPHTLKVGVTLQHLLRLEWVDADGIARTTGSGAAWERGCDLVALLAGSEGTLGLVTAADLRLTPDAPALATLLALFPRLDDATAAVVELLGAGLLPEAVEMVDRPMLEAVEQAFRFGFPTDVEAAMIVEFGGLPEAVEEDAARAEAALRGGGARDVRRARDAQERLDLWRCRKKAFGAVGRLAPSYVTMDVCVPLARLPEIVRATGAIARRHGVRVATAFHAGDGNLHPGVHYDERDPDLARRAHAAADEILDAALAMGGSVTGEHGVGLEKLHVVGRQLDPVAADLMRGLRRLADPRGLCNPGKALPPPDAAPSGPAAAPPREARFDWASLTVTAPGDADFAALQDAALARGFWVPCGALLPRAGGPGLGAAGALGSLVAHGVGGPSLLGAGPVRDWLLEVWATTGDGRRLRAGAPVVKNVAGFDLVRLLCGSGGTLATITGATLALRPAPEAAVAWRFAGRPVGPGGEAAALGALLGHLLGRPRELSAPAVAAERGDDGAWTLWVLDAGRDRPWDLGRRRDAFARLAAAAGLAADGDWRLPFPRVADLAAAAALPAWARAHPDWLLGALRGGAPTPPAAAVAAGRFVFQAAPALIWVPTASPATADPRWLLDAVARDGAWTALPPPGDPGVPRPLLAGIRALFDPDGRLPGPEWMAAPAAPGAAP